MKILLLLMIAFGSSIGFSQEAQADPHTTRYFAQGKLTHTALQETEIIQLEQNLRSLPGIFIVRLDRTSNSFIIMIDQETALTEAQLLDWFGPLSNTVSCIQIGIDGVDERNVYPFTNCPN